MEDYKISLGVDIDVGDIRTQLNDAENKLNPIKLNIEIENLNDIKKQIQNLGGIKGNTKVSIPVDTATLENSLRDVKGVITDIKTSIGTLDSKSGMKSLLSSINQIGGALDKVSNKFDELNAELKSLSAKDFNINLGINMGGSNPIGRNASYGNKVRNETLPQLKQQMNELVKYYNAVYKSSLNEFEVLQKMVTGTKLGTGDFFENFLFGKDSVASRMNSGSLASQMQAYKEYIDMFKQAASLRGLDLTSVMSSFSKSADSLVKDAQNIQSGANEMQEGFEKYNFNIEGISQQLDSVVVDLNEIKISLKSLSDGDPLSGLTQSFEKLSASIDELIQRCTDVNRVINSSVGDLNNSISQSNGNVGSEIADSFDKNMESIQASATETSGVIKELQNTLQKMRLDRSSIDAITKDVEELGFEVTDASVKMKNGNFDITVKGVDDVGRAVTEIRHLNSATQEISGVSRTISKSFKETDAFINKQKQSVSNLTNQINQLNRSAIDQNAPRPIKETAHLDSLKAKYNEIISAIDRMGAASSSTFEDERNKVRTLIGEYKSLKSEYKNAENVALEMDGNDFASGLEIAKNKLAEFKSQAQGFSQLTQTVKDLDKAIEGVGDVSSLKEFNNQLRVAKSELSKVKSETRSVGEIKFRLSDTGFNGFAQEVKRAESAVNSLQSSTPELQSALQRLKTALESMNSANEVNDIQRLRDANKEYENSLKQVYSQLKLNQQTEQKASFEIAKEGALLRLKGLFSENSEAAKRFGSELDRIQRELNECGDTKGLAKINREITNLGREIKNTGVKTQTFGEKFKKQWQQYTSYLSVASIFSYGTQALRDMFEQVKLIDSAMTELKKVTNETDATYNKFLSNAADRAREIGTTIDGLVKSTANFARLGYGFEDAQGLAEVANIYAVVGDEIEGVEGATESLISTMAAFKDEMNGMSNTDFAMSIIDKFNEIGNNFAISSGGIGEALERSASSLMAANNTIDESIALITAANTVVQSPEQVGNAFKTISMRIRGAKTELEEMGEDTTGMVESTAKLREEILALSGVDIMENGNEFKSTYKIMDELAQKWEDLTDIQQAKCLPDNVEIH